MTSLLRCGGCGWSTSELAFRCAHAGTDHRDHVLQPVQGAKEWPTSRDPNPFIRYRTLLHAYGRWIARGGSDDAWCDRVSRLDERVAAVDGRGFGVTPVSSLTGVLAKDETGNVAGSHKGRHLFGTLLALDDDGAGELAIASCGNAALAAAVVARAAERPLRVFVPTWAPEDLVTRLDALGASVEVCSRVRDEPGDPCVTRFRLAVADGAVPFSCQGTDNAIALDGGRTLGWELADQLADLGTGADHVVVQVGGGALASSTFHALAEAVTLGRVDVRPRLHAVQACGAAPLVRAWEAVSALAATKGWAGALESATSDRARFMRPWDTVPESAATGILDDETYDWLAILRAVADSRGTVISVDEESIAAATAEARRSVPRVGPTGAAGLAGARALQGDGAIRDGERVVVVLSGIT